MAYKVLYRKYRPQDFNDLCGQEAIKNILVDSIKNDKIAHAYCFSGPRGTGKTSTAKLFAKAINCEHSVDGIPCGQCQSCLNFNENPDIIEIDAASNNGVDEIRELRDNVKILPTFSKYKIYIIDEVHMLSQSAWNAFLKTLEEPPKHVIFILATTEIQKIPITVLSRCQRYTFKKITKDVIKQRLLTISKEEQIEISDEASDYIAELADGGLRDALGYLDQLSKENTKITVKTIQECFGLIGNDTIENIFKFLNNSELDEIINIFNEIESQGLDVNLIISKIIDFLYKEEINIINKKNVILTNYSLETIKKLSFDISNCYLKKEGLKLIEVTILSYISQHEIKEKIISREIISNSEELKTSKTTETKNSKQEEDDFQTLKKENKSNLINKTNNSLDELKKIRSNNSFVGASKTYKEQFSNIWEELKKKLKFSNIDLYSIIEDVNIEVASNINVLFSHPSISGTIIFNSNLEHIEQELKNKFEKDYKIICLSSEEWIETKNNFIKNKNKIYEYIPETTEPEEKNTEKNDAMEIFGEELVEIK